jgi:hypothetical protein
VGFRKFRIEHGLQTFYLHRARQWWVRRSTQKGQSVPRKILASAACGLSENFERSKLLEFGTARGRGMWAFENFGLYTTLTRARRGLSKISKVKEAVGSARAWHLGRNFRSGMDSIHFHLTEGMWVQVSAKVKVSLRDNSPRRALCVSFRNFRKGSTSWSCLASAGHELSNI